MNKITVEEEFRKLCDWTMTEMEKANRIPWSGGLDGPATERGNEVMHEYNRRLRELKKKYNTKNKKE